MSNVQKTNSNGLEFFSILGLIFITLKLTEYINWSWWYVLAPIYAPFLLFGIGVVIGLIKHIIK